MKLSAQAGDVLVAYALGSCLGLAIYDPVARVGGLLHVMLPSSSIDPRKAAERPYMFVDTGVPRLFQECYRVGADKRRLVVKVAGGASINRDLADDSFRIGARNYTMLRRLLSRNSVRLHGVDVGGIQSRTVSLEIGTGNVTVKSQGTTTRL